MDFIKSFKENLFSINATNFNKYCLELFNFQAKENIVYNNYLQNLKRDPESIQSVKEIPFLPISLFKSHEIKVKNTISQTVFQSSGTTGMTRSKHYISDPAHYLHVCSYIFEKFYGEISDSIILALLPSYQENPSSSLICMVNHLIDLSGCNVSGFVKNKTQVISKLAEARQTERKIVLFGVSYALLDLAEEGINLSDVVVIETGGMKGRRKEITRAELHLLLKNGLKTSEIHSEYGMTELLSQAYSIGEIFKAPPWMKVFTREINDPFSDNSNVRNGVLKVIDLANIESCAFIETEDLGFVYPDYTFKVLGRVDNSEIRGCNLLYEL